MKDVVRYAAKVSSYQQQVDYKDNSSSFLFFIIVRIEKIESQKGESAEKQSAPDGENIT